MPIAERIRAGKDKDDPLDELRAERAVHFPDKSLAHPVFDDGTFTGKDDPEKAPGSRGQRADLAAFSKQLALPDIFLRQRTDTCAGKLGGLRKDRPAQPRRLVGLGGSLRIGYRRHGIHAEWSLAGRGFPDRRVAEKIRIEAGPEIVPERQQHPPANSVDRLFGNDQRAPKERLLRFDKAVGCQRLRKRRAKRQQEKEREDTERGHGLVGGTLSTFP